MKTKKLWIIAAITAIIIVILFFATYKTDEERLIGKWNWFDTSGEIGFSITCEKDHTGEVYRYGKTNSMEWHIDDGFFYMYERNQYGQVTEYKFTYKQDGVVLLLENEEGELRLYLDGKPRNAVEGVEQLNIGTVVAGTEGLFVNGHMDKKHSAYVLKEGYDLDEIKGNYIIAKYNDEYSLFSLSGKRELESSYSSLSFVEPSESKKFCCTICQKELI